MGERSNRTAEVRGSIPLCSTNLPNSGIVLDIQPYRLDHAGAICALLSDPRIGLPLFGDVAGAEAVARHVSAEWCPGNGSHRIVALLDGSLAAAASVVGAEVSFFVDPRFWGRGIATAITRQACRDSRGLSPHRAIRAAIFRENVASIRVVERLGFCFSGLRHRTLLYGHRRAVLDYNWPVPV